MNIRAALRQAIARLTTAQVPSATITAEVLLMHVLGRDRAFLYAHPEAELTLEQERAYRHLLAERVASRPTQYLTGEQEFWGLNFIVRPGVFIPRPETEHVVEVALELVRTRLQKPAARIVDVGTGSGCIALALANELPQAEIIGTDIDENAVALARENAVRLRLAHRVRFEKSDLLELFLVRAHEPRITGHEPRATNHGLALSEGEGPRFDLIVSNPPYVSEAEFEQLPREVRDFEPRAAIFSPDQGLAFTCRLLAQAVHLLRPGGWLVLELGYNMERRVRALLGEAWTNIEVTDDLHGIPRVLAAEKR